MNIISNNTYFYHPAFSAKRRFNAESIKDIESQVVDLYKKNVQPAEISKTLNVGLKAVNQIIRELVHKPAIINKRGSLYSIPLATLTPEEIQNILDCDKKIANKIYTKIKEPPRITKRYETCQEILRLQREGHSISEIAEMLNRSERNIKDYLKYCKDKNLDIIL